MKSRSPAIAGTQPVATPIVLGSGYGQNILSKKPWLAYVCYAAVALAVLLPLFKPGFIFTLDFVFAPELPMPSSVTSSYLFHAGLHVLNYVLPSDVIQKLLLLVILLVSAIGMHKLIQSLAPAKKWGLGIYIASAFFAINPFTYSRFMVGQFAVLLGYALLPWLVRAMLSFGRKPAIKQTVTLGLLATLVAIASIHMVVAMAVLSMLAACLVFVYKHGQWGTYARQGLIVVGIFLALSSYWLVPLALGKGTTAKTIQSFTTSDTQTFATSGSNILARTFNVVRLQGFWAERRDLYLLPQDRMVLWGLMSMVIIALVVFGAIQLWKTRPLVVLFLSSSGFLALLLAIGIGSQVVSDVGLREPHKLVALVALAYGVFLAYGVEEVLKRANKKHTAWGVVVSIWLLALPFMHMRVMLWGFDGQITPRDYPKDWYALKEQLSTQPAGNVLFLPWHQYMTFQFAGRIIANPASAFFGPRIISSPDPELEGAQGRPPTPQEKAIASLLTSKGNTSFSKTLTEQNVAYIVLAKELDYSSYAYLNQLPHIQPIKNSTTFTLYKNQAWKGTP